MTNSLTSRIYISIGVLFLAFVFMVQTVAANTVVRSGETVSVAEGQSVSGDFYVAAGTINISGLVEEDALLLGGQVTVNGSITDNAFIVGGNVDIHGTVGDDLRIIGGEVTIAEPVAGDVAIVGGSVNILSSASIGGDLLIYGGDVVVEGPIAGDLLGSVSNLRLDAFVGGGVDVRVTNLVLGDQANLEGGLVYNSFNIVERSLNAVVSGEVVRNDPIVSMPESSRFGFLIPSLLSLFSILSWYLVSRKTLSVVVDKAIVKSPKPVLIGFALFFLAPIAAIILISSMIGSVIGLAILFSYLLTISLAVIVIPAVLGHTLMMAFTKTNGRINLLSILIGILVMTVLSQLPIIGPVFIFVLLLISIGALVDSVHNPKTKN